MTDEDKQYVGAEVDQELVEQIKGLGHGAISETIREAFRRRAGASVKYELKEEREELADVEEQIAEVESEIETAMELLTERVNRHSELINQKRKLEDKIDSLEAEREREKVEREEEREDVLHNLVELLRDGQHIFPSHGKVQDAATKLDESPEKIIKMMKERHPDLPDHAFRPATETDRDWHGLDGPDMLSSASSEHSRRYSSLAEDEDE